MPQVELLLPVGNPESFYAAVQGGADAVYLGLQQFNARGRAKNFTIHQLPVIVTKAHQHGMKVYITLNTVIKNKEISDILDYLQVLSQAEIDGVIIQDWGVYYLARKYFPNLALHASTQMGNHNSVGTEFSSKKGFKRVVLARELTLKELESICLKSKIETEVFIHGALCYSFSGMCLYSSYVGGRGANRGLCAQPCRRTYKGSEKSQFIFNLKDNQQIDLIPKLQKIGVSSLKVEGRMKSGEYTYQVASAYRLALSDTREIQGAKLLLEMDFGREKTAYFLGNDVKTAISEKTVAGVLLGTVKQVQGKQIWFISRIKLEEGFRLRFHMPGEEKQDTVRVDKVRFENGLYLVKTAGIQVRNKSEVYLTGMSEMKFPSRIEEQKNLTYLPIRVQQKKSILDDLKDTIVPGREEYYFRIQTMDWLPFMNPDQFTGLFLAFSKINWSRVDLRNLFIQHNKDKIFVELPRFISESSTAYYSDLIQKSVDAGIRNFVLSHFSQKNLIPSDCCMFTNENVYVFNDAAARCLHEDGIEDFVYPQEMDFDTLFSLSGRKGIVPVYFYPELFYSRMPVHLTESEDLTDSMDLRLRRYRRNGLTSVVPSVPVSISQSKNKLVAQGFSRFLIDLSYEPVSKNRIKTIKSRVVKSEQIQPSTTFNFNKGLQ